MNASLSDSHLVPNIVSRHQCLGPSHLGLVAHKNEVEFACEWERVGQYLNRMPECPDDWTLRGHSNNQESKQGIAPDDCAQQEGHQLQKEFWRPTLE